ncbi:DUF4160 domain-containing protein [Methylocystis rosea]|jgi:hypothetical protein|uniref:DUF4160 domain-containing protein n=1 Tax=Methylocystis rosea TaxID=173366 RepID=UPI000367216C|nr:DUF4160 domain-containing protein [Methylocystis rosea]KAF0120354.1 MAG: hypothetical protein FD148_3547 [Methylocystaceae bacterium]KAF0211667.1 MAG: hypothetical protein FD172_1728 [Methylocystaceae bacterium]PPC99594.1 MAG: DUF4160 domain-containing protein [Methylocystis sp.]TXT46131.1 MAG: hypothetical protein FD139_1172 [Methylocystaceae bacterium]
MPTVLRWKGYRFFFYSADGWEPAHVHVTKDAKEAKIWLENVSVAVNMGFTAQDLNEIVKKTREERESFLRSWNDYFAN